MNNLTPEQIDQAAAAMWNSTASVPWDQIPEAWKPFYRRWAEAAIRTVKPETAFLKDPQ